MHSSKGLASLLPAHIHSEPRSGRKVSARCEVSWKRSIFCNGREMMWFRLSVTQARAISSHVCMASPRLLQKYGVAFAHLAALIAGAGALTARAQATPPPDRTRVPVLVELFTSEGCSDCPPADRLLDELDARQFVPGAKAIVLSEHVTYWNHQGWQDPFSLDEIDSRQQEYGAKFHLDSVYTPQAVVDGAAQVVGNNVQGVTGAVANAASRAKTPLTIVDPHWENGAVAFTVRGEGNPSANSGFKLLAALAADAAPSKVSAGENAGRTLQYVAVVRVLKQFGADAIGGKPLRLSAGSPARQHDTSGQVRLVVWLADRKTGHVAAVAEARLSK